MLTPELPQAFGRYTLLRRLATGGMAEVYLARDCNASGFEKQVAVKWADAAFPCGSRPSGLAAEAKLVVDLVHPNIVQTFDLERYEDTSFMVMEYVAGLDAQALMAELRSRRRRMPPTLAAFIISELCKGLAFAHGWRERDGRAAGIVHRDVSPQNILIGLEGEVKVADFGIAKTRDRRSDPDARVIKGKYVYMSPEQASAEPIDRRSDLYSAGIVLFELLTGERPYRAATVRGLLDEVRAAAVPPPSTLRRELVPALDRIVACATAQDPSDRYDDADAMAADLDGYLGSAARRQCRARLAALVLEASAGKAQSPDFEPPALPVTRDGRTRRTFAEPATPPAIPLRYELSDGRPTLTGRQPEARATSRPLRWILCGLASAALLAAAYLLHGV